MKSSRGHGKSEPHGMQPTATKEAFLSGRHGQTAFAGKPTPEVEGGAVIFSFQQQGSACVCTLVTNCRGGRELLGPSAATLPCRAGTVNPHPAPLLSLAHDVAEHRSPTASHSSVSPSSRRRAALLGLAQQSHNQCQGPRSPAGTPNSAGLPPARKAG